MVGSSGWTVIRVLMKAQMLSVVAGRAIRTANRRQDTGSGAPRPASTRRAARRGSARIRPLGVAVLLGLGVLLSAPIGAAAAATWHASAEGIRVGERHSSSGTPPDDVTVTSVNNYQVSLSFSFDVRKDGTIAGTGSGHYDDAHWHLAGHNGTAGDFSCDPTVTGAGFRVRVGGHATGDRATLSLSMNGQERNDDYDCGANFTGFATTSHYMSDSLDLVGGGSLGISLRHPQLPTLTKTVDTGTDPNTRHSLNIWSFSFTPPATGGASAGGGGAGGAGGGGGGGARCRLRLSRLRVAPSQHPVGMPASVLFSTTAAARARLLVTPADGRPRLVVSQSLGAGPHALIWGGWLDARPAPAGGYRLTVEARGCHTTRRRSVVIAVT